MDPLFALMRAADADAHRHGHGRGHCDYDPFRIPLWHGGVISCGDARVITRAVTTPSTWCAAIGDAVGEPAGPSCLRALTCPVIAMHIACLLVGEDDCRRRRLPVYLALSCLSKRFRGALFGRSAVPDGATQRPWLRTLHDCRPCVVACPGDALVGVSTTQLPSRMAVLVQVSTATRALMVLRRQRNVPPAASRWCVEARTWVGTEPAADMAALLAPGTAGATLVVRMSASRRRHLYFNTHTLPAPVVVLEVGFEEGPQFCDRKSLVLAMMMST